MEKLPLSIWITLYRALNCIHRNVQRHRAISLRQHWFLVIILYRIVACRWTLTRNNLASWRRLRVQLRSPRQTRQSSWCSGIRQCHLNQRRTSSHISMISYIITATWNSLPPAVINCDTLSVFKSAKNSLVQHCILLAYLFRQRLWSYGTMALYKCIIIIIIIIIIINSDSFWGSRCRPI